VDPGHDPRQLVAGGAQTPTIAWSPDETSVAYTSTPISGGTTAPSVWVVGLDGRKTTRVGDGELVSWVAAESLLVKEGGDMALLGLTNGEHRILGASTAFEVRYPSVWSAFSHDGEWFAFVGDANAGSANALVVCHTFGGGCRRFATRSDGPISGPSFSPDDTGLTYVAGGALRVLALELGTGDVRVIVRAESRVVDELGKDLIQGAGDGVRITRGTYPNVPVWLSDGTILYHRGAELRVIDPDTGTSTVIAEPIGFSDAGAKDQGLPGGSPIAEIGLTSRLDR
jgi:hypothetical protein